ncbi:zinc finger protein 142-like [Anoplophora glabripennis]|uniref:zinc finger protein 142-like n=1 Tax=Anoplophora glabripennis TaxID=217634 RepID=UPI000873F332|nr:zinc finger protein 142-like [Anoplophora glabripennis]
MGDSKETSCRLCLKSVTNKCFEVIDDVIKNILGILSLKLKFNSESEQVICNACRRKLNAALGFKSICWNTDNAIVPYVDREKLLQLDLREVYMKEKGSERLIDISCDQQVCRLCMELVESEFRCIRDEELEAIKIFVPEMNVTTVKDPVVCKPCFDSLCAHNTFLKDCLAVEETICDSPVTKRQTEALPPDLLIKIEMLDEESKIDKAGTTFKTEFVDVKSEYEGRCDGLPGRSNNAMFENDFKHAQEGGCNHDESGSIRESLASTEVSNECDKCNYETESNIHFLAPHENFYKPHKCGPCEYETENSKLLQTNKDVRMFKCDLCSYESKYKMNLTQHQAKHKSTSEAILYKCDDCDFQTKYRSGIYRHRSRHKDSSEVPTYKCTDCEYETRTKYNLTTHRLVHDNPSGARKYTCTLCEYETSYKSNFKSHQLKHENPSAVQMYVCEDCDYKTEQKHYLARHALKHKDCSQVPMNRCNVCDYQSKYKKNLIRHELTHKDASQVQTYRCNDCDFETKHRGNIKFHVLKHRDRSQVPLYRCEVCEYESMYKRNFTLHQLKHKDASQVEMYRCDACDFETKYKKSLKYHKLNHKRTVTNV